MIVMLLVVCLVRVSGGSREVKQKCVACANLYEMDGLISK